MPDKREKLDVHVFSLDLMDNIFLLSDELASHAYHHGTYQAFGINDPKQRQIHKATVRDRLLHHAAHRKLYPFFASTFIADSYSCQLGKGTHRALNRFRRFGYIVSKNNTRTCWVLKCDIRKFFANIDHGVLKNILARYISDADILWLLCSIIDSFHSTRPRIGLPLGNLTSQLFVNIYMNEFDQFVKHRLRAEYYVRYADDFLLLSCDRDWLMEQIQKIADFLQENLKLELHPDKLSIKTLSSGVDFLGWVHFPDHRVLRTTTKRRLFKRITEHPGRGIFDSYLGMLQHGNATRIKNTIMQFAKTQTDL